MIGPRTAQRPRGVGVAQHAFPIADAARAGTRRPRHVSQRDLAEFIISVGALMDEIVGGFDGRSVPARYRNEFEAVARNAERLGYPVQGPNRVVRGS